MVYHRLFNGHQHWISFFSDLYAEAFEKEGSIPPPPPGGRMEYEDFGNMLFEDGVEMAYES